MSNANEVTSPVERLVRHLTEKQMRILYNESKDTTEVFEFDINQGGELQIRVSNGSKRKVKIIFCNQKFKMVDFEFADGFLYSRSYWHVMGAIAQKITEIEHGYASGKCA